jgi:3-methyl-2-oxobutanoate hydroxymethyltransferase
MESKMRKITLYYLQNMKNEQKKISMLTLYDASFARIASEVGVDILFIGDSIGMVLKNQPNTIDVKTEEIAYHTRCVSAGNLCSAVMADLPFMSYYTSTLASKNAKLLLQAGAEIVKIEGGAFLCDTIYFLAKHGVPVCAHIGLTPQFIHTLGGFKIQGRNETQAKDLLDAAISLEQAGASMLLLECIPYLLAQKITQVLKIPVIGIGAGPYCDGQVLVAYDILGLTLGNPKKFVKNFLEESTEGIKGAIEGYVHSVKQGTFPTLAHSFE